MRNVTLILLAVLLSSCATHKPMRAWNASTTIIPPNSMMTFLDRENGKLSVVYTEDIIRILDIKARIEEVAGVMHTDLLIAEGEQPNGYSFVTKQGPRIAVNFGMMQMLAQDDDAMAALIGHELAHLYLEHGRLRQEREANRITTSVVLTFALGMFGIPMPVDVADAATSAVTRSYSRDDERAADQLGVEYMVKAGFDPFGSVHLQEKLGAAAKGTSLSFLSTHPSNKERVENMKYLAQEYQQKAAPSTEATDTRQSPPAP